MNVTLKKAVSFETCKPGEWVKDSQGRVFVVCPHEHAYPAMIMGHLEASKNWQIDARGRVTPSIWIKGDCDWHVFATLDGWAEGGTVMPEWLIILAFGVLIGLTFARAMLEPARSSGVDRWRDVYDENCRLVLPQKGKEPYDIR